MQPKQRHQIQPTNTANFMSYPQANLFPVPKAGSPLTTSCNNNQSQHIRNSPSNTSYQAMITMNVPTPQPSTPSFLNIQSPDLKSYKALPNSPIKTITAPSSSSQGGLPGLPTNSMMTLDSVGFLKNAPSTPPSAYSNTFNDFLSGNIFGSNHLTTSIENMDFEAAYALLTQSPPTSLNTTNNIDRNMSDHRFPNSLTPLRTSIRTQQISEYNNDSFPNIDQNLHTQLNSTSSNHDLKEYLLLSNTPSPRIITPKLSTPTFLKPVPFSESLRNSNSASIDTLLEMLPGPRNHQPTEEHLLLTENETNALDMFLDSIIDDKKLPEYHQQSADHYDLGNNMLQNHGLSLDEISKNDSMEETQHTVSLRMKEEKSDGFDLISLEQQNQGDIVKVPENQKDTKTETKVQQNIKKSRRKRKNLLSEDQKKQNHISSEQRRRQLIKEKFDQLIRLLPESQIECTTKNTQRKKQMAKSDVLEVTVREIELLNRITVEMKQALAE